MLSFIFSIFVMSFSDSSPQKIPKSKEKVEKFIKVPAGKAIVHELLHQDDAMLFAVLPDNSTLVGNAGRFAILPFFIGKAVVGVC